MQKGRPHVSSWQVRQTTWCGVLGLVQCGGVSWSLHNSVLTVPSCNIKGTRKRCDFADDSSYIPLYSAALPLLSRARWDSCCPPVEVVMHGVESIEKAGPLVLCSFFASSPVNYFLTRWMAPTFCIKSKNNDGNNNDNNPGHHHHAIFVFIIVIVIVVVVITTTISSEWNSQ